MNYNLFKHKKFVELQFVRGIGEKTRFAVLFAFCTLFSIFTFDSVSATDHTATITTSGEVNLSSPAGSTTIGSSKA